MRIYGLGCMALSDVDEAAALRTIHAALDAGVRWLDTADVYAPDAQRIGHNEALVARALETWSGPRQDVVVSTKGGLVREAKRWRPDGRKKHIEAACRRSLEALGRDRHDVYFLHAPDPKTPWATSVRALDGLAKKGLVRSLGLSNVTVAQIEEARSITAIDVVQIELGVRSPAGFESGVPEYCRREGLRLLAARPLGGAAGCRALKKNAVLRAIAADHGVTAEDVALAWLYHLDPALVALPGATHPETAERAVADLALSEDERSRLTVAFPAGVQLAVPRAERRPPRGAVGDVVVIMGFPGAGKTSRAQSYEERGYLRLNRDELKGRLAGLVPLLSAALESGARDVVLDNTYPDRASRNRIIEAAWRAKAPVRCEWVTTTLEESQTNAVLRMLKVHGALLDAQGIRSLTTPAENTFLPSAQYRYRDRFEAPTKDEGFESVVELPFERRPVGDRPGVIVDADELLFGAPDAPLLAALRLRADRGFVLGAIAWQPAIGAGREDEAAVVERVEAARTAVARPIAIAWCPHPAGPTVCWCRPPLPGLPLLLAYRGGIDLARAIFVGSSPTMRALARRFQSVFSSRDAFVQSTGNGE